MSCAYRKRYIPDYPEKLFTVACDDPETKRIAEKFLNSGEAREQALAMFEQYQQAMTDAMLYGFTITKQEEHNE